MTWSAGVLAGWTGDVTPPLRTRAGRPRASRRDGGAPRLTLRNEEERPPLVAHLGDDGQLRLLFLAGAAGCVGNSVADRAEDALHIDHASSGIAENFGQRAGEGRVTAF